MHTQIIAADLPKPHFALDYFLFPVHINDLHRGGHVQDLSESGVASSVSGVTVDLSVPR